MARTYIACMSQLLSAQWSPWRVNPRWGPFSGVQVVAGAGSEEHAVTHVAAILRMRGQNSAPSCQVGIAGKA